MWLLSVETSSLVGSIALHKDKELVGEKSWNKKVTGAVNPSHSELLTTSVMDLLGEVGISIKDITHLALGVGPGSFTGIRVGVNFIRALAYVQNLSVFTADSLSIIAHSVDLAHFPKNQDLLVAISAFRNFLYFQKYLLGPLAWQSIEGPGVITLDQLKSSKYSNCVVVGDGAKFLGATSSLQFPQARHLGEMAQKHGLTNSQFKTWKEVIPLYIRRSEAEEKFGVVAD